MRRIVNWIKKHLMSLGTLIGFLIGVLIIGIPDLLVSTSSQLGETGASTAISFIELIALIIPALAILLQVNIQVSRSSGIALLGHGGELRKVSFYIAVLSLVFLVVALVSLGRYMSLPNSLSITLKLITISVIFLAAMPALSTILYAFGDTDEFGAFTDRLEAYNKFKKIEELDESEFKALSKNISLFESKNTVDRDGKNNNSQTPQTETINSHNNSVEEDGSP